MNCIDNCCKYSYVDCRGEYCCAVIDDNIPDEQPEDCKYFLQAHTCINCKYSKETVYETGTIDDIEYRCPFQDNKLIYDDLSPYSYHFYDVPECNIDKFEEIKT